MLQGERPMAADNKSLGRFILDGIPPAPRGVPQVEVTFDIDANGILNVSARDKATGREQKITITASSGLSEAEIQKMVKDAEQHASDDAKRKESVEAKNQAETAVFNAEKFLRDYGDKIPAEAKTQTEERIESVRQAITSDNVEQMRSTVEALNQQMQTLGAQMYEQPGAAGPTGEPGGDDSQQGQGKSGEDVVDAEFTEA